MKVFTVDLSLCNGCYCCQIACKDEHVANDWTPYAKPQPDTGQFWIGLTEEVRGHVPHVKVTYTPLMCNHCDDAPCIKAARDGAVYKREDGIVIIDPQKAKGQKELVKSCPFGAIWWNEEAQIAQKCTFCAHLLDKGWKKPRCVQSCPTGALSILHVEEEELGNIIREDKLKSLDGSDSSAQPRCFYKNLYRYSKCFIAGSVASGDDTVSECVEGVKVQLLKDDLIVGDQKTDYFGDFKFDMLSPGGGAYSIAIESEKGIKKKIDVKLKKSLSVGTLWIK